MIEALPPARTVRTRSAARAEMASRSAGVRSAASTIRRTATASSSRTAARIAARVSLRRCDSGLVRLTAAGRPH